MPRIYVRRPLRELFDKKVNKRGPNDCWLWTGGTNGTGYGHMTLNNRKNAYAHRLAYEFAHGPIPEGLTIDHLCRVRLCVNPAHLEPVTFLENIKRATPYRIKSHCKQGHEYNEVNSHRYFYYGKVFRQCKICRKDRERQKTRRGE